MFYTYTQIQTCLSVYACLCKSACVYAWVIMLLIWIRVYICMWVCGRMNIHVCTASSVSTSLCLYVYIWKKNKNHVYLCIRICAPIHTHTRPSMYTHIEKKLYKYTHVHMSAFPKRFYQKTLTHIDKTWGREGFQLKRRNGKRKNYKMYNWKSWILKLDAVNIPTESRDLKVNCSVHDFRAGGERRKSNGNCGWIKAISGGMKSGRDVIKKKKNWQKSDSMIVIAILAILIVFFFFGGGCHEDQTVDLFVLCFTCCSGHYCRYYSCLQYDYQSYGHCHYH